MAETLLSNSSFKTEVSSPSKTPLDWVSFKEALGLKGLLVLREEKELERKRRDKRVALLLFGEYSESFVFGGETAKVKRLCSDSFIFSFAFQILRTGKYSVFFLFVLLGLDEG